MPKSLINVGVLRGGPTSEYDVSLRTGQHILNLLNKEPLSNSYKGIDILIDRDGVWHIDGAPISPELAVRKVDVMFNATKGGFEKGQPLQRILESFSMPFVGTNTFGAAVAGNKRMAKEHFKTHGIKTPYFKELNLAPEHDLHPIAVDLFRSFPMPVVVKPVGQGSSLGVSFASNFDELLKALDHARGFSNEVLVEEYLTGKEIISGFIDDFRGQDLYHLFPVEVRPHTETNVPAATIENVGTNIDGTPREVLSDVVADAQSADVTVDDLSEGEKEMVAGINDKNMETPAPVASNVDDVSISPKKPKHSIFNWVAKHAGLYDHISPANLTGTEKQIIQDAMKKIRDTLGLRHFATADFIVHPKRGVYLLEINTDPSLHEHAPIYKALDAAGVKHHEFLDHILKLALGGKK